MGADPSLRTAERKARIARNIRLSSATFLASSLVHELSQPLSAINAWSTTCLNLVKQNRGSRERLAERLDSLVHEAQRATGIIREFRKTLSQRSHEFSEIDLSVLLPQLAELLEEEAAASGVKVVLAPGPGRCLIAADPALVEMAVYLLFRNSLEAIKCRPRQSNEVAIKWRTGKNASVTVTVEDTGPGVDEAVVSHLFEPFVSTAPNGVGLGLALCRAAVESLGGRVWLEFSSGAGAAFAFELPGMPDGKEKER